MVPGSLRIGTIAGIEISIHVSWLIIVVLLTWSLEIGWFPALSRGWSPLVYWGSACLRLCCWSSRCYSMNWRTPCSPLKTVTIGFSRIVSTHCCYPPTIVMLLQE
jgi:hypothetical protein